MDIIDWLQQHGYHDLTREHVEEEYTSGINTDNEYLRTHRIELDSISEKVGPEFFGNTSNIKSKNCKRRPASITLMS